MSVEKQLWTLNPYLIKTIPLYILSMPKLYLNELLEDTNIIVCGKRKGTIILERPVEVDGQTYKYMDWDLFRNLLTDLKDNTILFAHSKHKDFFSIEKDIYNILNRKFNFNDKTIERFKYYMLLLFLSAWKRNPEWVDESLVELWKKEVMQDIMRVGNLKMTPYGERDVELKEILKANKNSRNLGVVTTICLDTYDTFISQKYQEVTSLTGNYNPLLIVTQMLVAPSREMENFWSEYDDVIPMLFLSKEKGKFRLLNYTHELFDQIK
ncbi:MAG: hypothetical protein ACW972_02090 [Promethearchaeota archaeon]|jgi:hypothetical protein